MSRDQHVSRPPSPARAVDVTRAGHWPARSAVGSRMASSLRDELVDLREDRGLGAGPDDPLLLVAPLVHDQGGDAHDLSYNFV